MLSCCHFSSELQSLFSLSLPLFLPPPCRVLHGLNILWVIRLLSIKYKEMELHLKKVLGIHESTELRIFIHDYLT